MGSAAADQSVQQQRAIPILMYHNIARLPPEIRVNRSLYVTPALFARQMWLLRRLGYTGLSMSAAMPYLQGLRQGRVVVITLDDGYRDNLEHALPVLQKQGFSATCYVVSDCAGQYNLWDADRLGVKKPLMSIAQLRTWHEAGMEVGAHTRTHPRLTRCDDTRLMHEIQGSKAALEDAIGAAVPQFCYPYGDLDPRIVGAVCAAGFNAATTTRRGRAIPGTDLWQLPRVPIARQHILPSFALRVLTGYEEGRK